MSNAEEEALADFVGENLLGTRDNLEETLQMLSGLNREKPSIFKKIRDFFKELLNRIKGVKGFGTLEADLEYLNRRLQELASSPDIENTATEGDVKYSITDGKITMNMSDDERAEVLNNTVIKLAEYDGKSDDLNGKNVLLLKSSYNSQAGKILKSLGEKFGVFKTYNNQNVSLDFDYSRGSLNESIHKQGDISTDFYDFAKMLYVFDEVVKNAVPIEAHTDKYKGTSRENTNLKSDYVLLSAFRDDNYVVPVEFHLKEMHTDSGQENKLYVSVTLGKIKMEDKVKVAVSDENHQTKDTRLSSAISIPDLISKVNPEYGNFYKYLPNSMLNEQQNNSKNTAVDDENYRLKVMRGEDVTDMLEEKAKEKGYSKDDSWKMDHKAPNSQDGYSNSMDNIDKSYDSDGSIYSQQAVYYYGEGREYDSKAISIIKSAKNNPEKMIKIYRAVPNEVKDTRVRNGDWVAIVKEYAIEHGGRVLDDDFRIIENTVPAKQLFSNGDSINEWGYDNGNANEVYKNSENNVKILDVTYDDNGKIIPLSERFNAQSTDEKYSIPVTETDKLLDKYDRGEITREEYYEALDRYTSKEVKRSIEAYEAKRKAKQEKYDAMEKHRKKVEEIREEAVRAERKEQELRKNRESNIYFIRRSVKRLDSALRTNSKAKHIPENLKGAITEFCKLFAENDNTVFEHKDLADIATYYRKFGNEKTDRMKYDPFISECLDSITEFLPGKKLTELSRLELEYVRTIADAMNYAVKEEENVFLDGKRAKLEEAGKSALKEISSAKPTFLEKARSGNVEEVKRYFVVGNLKPIYFFKRLGGTYLRAFENFTKGQDKFARNMDYSQRFIEETKNKYSYDTWKKDTVTLEANGEKYSISVEQALQLVATAEREKKNEIQASRHLSLGGVVFDTETLRMVYKAQRKVKNSENTKRFDSANEELELMVEKLKSRPIQLTFADIDSLSKKLTADQKGYMREFVKFLSTECAAWGNEVTLEQYGYRQYNEDSYFPYVSAKNFLYTDPAKGADNALRHASFTNSLQKNANNPLVISSFTDVALTHIEQMASYNAMTVPVETLNKLFNYKTDAAEGISSRSMKTELENKFGEASVKYIENFIRDVNNGVRGNDRDSFINSLNSKFKKTAVLGNLSVILKQPTAIIRACADMDVKYMLKASKYHTENNYEEMKEFAPVAIIKQMGSFDTGVGVKNSTWLSGERTFMESLDDVMGKGAEKADEIAWSYLWSATKAEIDGTMDLKPGTAEFLEAAGERVSHIINKTQVYDSVLSKSDNMRNKGVAGVLTSFMAEPTTEINMLYDTYSDLAQGKVSVKHTARVTNVLIISSLATAIMGGFAYAMRDDDEDKSFLEKWAYQSAGAFVGDLNPLSKIPYIRDIFSIWDGYDMERQDISAVSDIVNAVKSLTKGEPSYYKVRKLAEAIANFYGVPVKNILRDIEATVRTFLQMFDDNTPTAEGITASISEGLSENAIIAIFTGKKS